jgi:tRNA pseudouridine55 synthase
MDGTKEYLATLRLGIETETQDTEGEITERKPVGEISNLEVEVCLQKFRGKQMQVPPAYSALKHKGKPLYYYARKGISVVKDARQVDIITLERTDGCLPLSGDEAYLSIRVVCSKGTYIRTLAADIGRSLGCGAHLVQLRRTRSGFFDVEDSLSWDDLNDDEALNRCIGKMITVEHVCKLLQ